MTLLRHSQILLKLFVNCTEVYNEKLLGSLYCVGLIHFYEPCDLLEIASRSLNG